jgi:hypothetical protein
VDAARVDGWMERFSGYRVHVSRARIQQWLDQWQNEHRDLGARLLDAVDFYREDQLANAYRSVLGNLPGWSKKASDREGRWRFVAFSTRAGESGERMLHTFRVAVGLTAERYADLFIHRSDLLRENLTADDTVVFVDDFAGTGQQAVDAWNESLGILLPNRPHTFLLLAVVIREAATKIGRETPIKVRAFRNLGPQDNFFAPGCTHFNGHEKARALDYCAIADGAHPRGFGECGVLLVLAHRCPNNSLPILHSNNPAFRGLFPR